MTMAPLTFTGAATPARAAASTSRNGVTPNEPGGPTNHTHGCQSGREVDATDDEFERLLDELASGPVLPHLPAEFARADIYADHY